LLGKCQAEVAARGGRRKFRFKNKLMSLDGSIIDQQRRVRRRHLYHRQAHYARHPAVQQQF